MKTSRTAMTAVVVMTAAATILSANPAEAAPPDVKWRFGIGVELIHTHYGAGLRVDYVKRHGPSFRILHQGDVILSANGSHFAHAHNSFDGRRILQNAVTGGGGGVVPTSIGQSYNGGPSVRMKILRHGQVTWLTVYPASNGGGVVPTNR